MFWQRMRMGFCPVSPANIRCRDGLNWSQGQKKQNFSGADLPAIVSACRNLGRSGMTGRAVPPDKAARRQAAMIPCCAHTGSRTAKRIPAFYLAIIAALNKCHWLCQMALQIVAPLIDEGRLIVQKYRGQANADRWFDWLLCCVQCRCKRQGQQQEQYANQGCHVTHGSCRWRNAQ